MMYTDICQITPVTYSDQYGEETIGTPFTIKCREEAEDKNRGQQTGNKTRSKRFYAIPPGTDVKKGYRIKTIKRRGIGVTDKDMKVDEVFPIGRTIPHHLEVYVHEL